MRNETRKELVNIGAMLCVGLIAWELSTGRWIMALLVGGAGLLGYYLARTRTK